MKMTFSYLSLCAAFAVAAPVAAQEVTIKIADSLPADHIITQYTTNVFMERVKEELGDRVAFEHYPAQQLAKAKDILSITQAGIADIGYMVQPGGKLDQLEFQPNGVRVLYNVALSPYQAIFSKRAEVASLADFAGKKMRSNPGAMELSLQSAGATPVRMTPPEIFDAMSKGTIDGALLPFASTFSYGLNQIVSSATRNANFGSVGITYSISQRKWDSLPADVQDVLTRIGREVTESACKTFDDAEKELATRMVDEGATVFDLSDAEKATLAESFQSVAKDWADALDKRGKQGSEILSDFRAEVERLRTSGS